MADGEDPGDERRRRCRLGVVEGPFAEYGERTRPAPERSAPTRVRGVRPGDPAGPSGPLDDLRQAAGPADPVVPRIPDEHEGPAGSEHARDLLQGGPAAEPVELLADEDRVGPPGGQGD